ncbi:MAG: succinate dehydrogenase/fumarate reductase iron-sulfur subunit, partial [Phycisphaerae bacterium]|nr:succinate dehydrogenase/fumarate reductase iron-sulfur subunit [Phycisphaerae bacterium]
MNFTLSIWRQSSPETKGKMVQYQMTDISEDTSLLEMLDMLNEELTLSGDEPVAFDSDCREGIC